MRTGVPIRGWSATPAHEILGLVDMAAIHRIAALLADRNSIDAEIASLIGRPMVSGHLGEWIAAQVFDIALETSATAQARDGHFRNGPLAGRSVNIKWYLKRDNILDIAAPGLVDYYLVLSGPNRGASSSRGSTRPWRVDNVYLFDARDLVAALRERRVHVGTASSVHGQLWTDAEIFPVQRNRTLPVSDIQRAALAAFATD